MKCIRTLAGTIAMLALALSLVEGVAGSFCLDPMTGEDDASAAHAAMGHGEPVAPASDGAPAQDDGPDCPISGAAPTQCTAAAIVPDAPAAAPQFPVTNRVGAPARSDMPGSSPGSDLFHPPRA